MVKSSADAEAARLNTLRRYQVLDTEPEDRFDALTQLAADICDAPIALISLIDAERQWFKSKVGIEVPETPRNVSFCAHAIGQSEVFMIPDARRDDRFATNPMVTSEPHIRFYAGAPLVTQEGHALGTLCVIDRVPRVLNSRQVRALQILAYEVISQLELRRKNLVLEEAHKRLQLILDAAGEGIYGVDATGYTSFVNPAAVRMLGWQPHELLGRRMHDVIHYAYADGQPYPAERCPIYAARREGAAHTVNGEVFWRKDGTSFPVKYTSAPIVRDDERMGAVVVFTDVTEGRRAETALRESEARKGAMLATALDCIIAINQASKIIEFNPAAEVVFGYTRAEVLGEDLAEKIIPPRLRDAHRKGLAHYLATGESAILGKRIEVSAMRADGGEFAAELAITRTPMDGPPEFSAYLRDITERKQAEERLKQLANYDALTQLPNRVLFMDRLGQALAGAARNQRTAAVLVLDLDNFKGINDTLGHETGDSLLKTAAGRLSSCVRACDTFARLGGDEFAVVLTEIAQRMDASRVAQRMLTVLSEPFAAQDQALSVTGSIGITLYPKDGVDAKTLLKHAEAAMYQAKDRGRNRYRHYSKALGARVVSRLRLENDLRRALAQEEFELHYQPQVELVSNRITALEALLRWRRPGSEALVSPAEFIPIAEQSGLIVPIGEWALRSACAQSRAWQAQGFGPLRVAVNISARQFHQPNVKRTVDRILAATGLDPTCLELELTESLLQNTAVETVLHALRTSGIKIAIDDFGTGYSSLSYLKRFSIDRLKIDRSFVQGVPEDADNAAIVKAIISMAHSLELEVTAEGVETVAQAEFLRSLGCDAMQGYLISKPLPPAELHGILARRDQWF
jgi:diguanylate cyclase (GGDEF)-like protein/PAS domain S-box-containing protein